MTVAAMSMTMSVAMIGKHRKPNHIDDHTKTGDNAHKIGFI